VTTIDPDDTYLHTDLTDVLAHLTKLGGTCTVEAGSVADYAEATMPDGLLVQVSPFVDARQQHDGWFIVIDADREDDTVYRSYPGGQDEQHGTATAPLLAKLDALLDWQGGAR
jgi:hypothetical protein